mmetsp:Transcript_17964/g.46036  ORF Transcript_17964/g.46036 Transcript_17964/m.46036 type:complete len:209 (-) Transcript_17964:368-994(-)
MPTLLLAERRLGLELVFVYARPPVAIPAWTRRPARRVAVVLAQRGAGATLLGVGARRKAVENVVLDTSARACRLPPGTKITRRLRVAVHAILHAVASPNLAQAWRKADLDTGPRIVDPEGILQLVIRARLFKAGRLRPVDARVRARSALFDLLRQNRGAGVHLARGVPGEILSLPAQHATRAPRSVGGAAAKAHRSGLALRQHERSQQ